MLSQQGQEKGDEKMVEQGKDLARNILSQFFDVPLEKVEFTSVGVQFNN